MQNPSPQIQEINALINEFNRYRFEENYQLSFEAARRLGGIDQNVLGAGRRQVIAKWVADAIVHEATQHIDFLSTSQGVAERARFCAQICQCVISDFGNSVNDDQIKIAKSVLEYANYIEENCNNPAIDLRDIMLTGLNRLFQNESTVWTNWLLSWFYMGLRRYSEAWRRDRYLQAIQSHNIKQPARDKRFWNGEPCEILLVKHHWGIGDLIVVIRYLPNVLTKVGKVYLSVPARLIPMIKSWKHSGDVTIIKDTETVECDAMIEAPCLPMALGLGDADVTPLGTYFAPDAEEIENWKRVVRRDGRPHVGLVWTGSKGGGDPRTVGFAAMSRLFSLSNVVFVGLELQKTELLRCSIPENFTDFGVYDTKSTAPIIAGLDMLVACDGGLAHLGGALGVKTAILLRKDPGFYWPGRGSDCVWYESARLFRQREYGRWDEVIDEVAAYIQQSAAV